MYRSTSLIQASMSQQSATHDYHMTSLSQLGAPGPNDLSSVCSRREIDEIRRLCYRINPNKHRYHMYGKGGGGRG